MIKFFRKIRYDLMEKNRTGQYFKYAIGEIVLVVIGILIALQINILNEKRKINNDIESVFTRFEQELENNIQAANDFLKDGYVQDSIRTLFRDSQVTPEMIRASPRLIIYDFDTYTQSYLDDRLDEIIALEKELPSQYSDLITELKRLKTRITSQRFWEGEAIKLSMSRRKENVDEFPWYQRYDSISFAKAINHALTDTLYRNKVNQYLTFQLDENVWDATLIRSSSVALLWKIKTARGNDNNIEAFFNELNLKPLAEYDCRDKPYPATDVNFWRNFIIYNSTNNDAKLYSVNNSSGEISKTLNIPAKQFFLEEFTLINSHFLKLQSSEECEKVFKLNKEDYLLID